MENCCICLDKSKYVYSSCETCNNHCHLSCWYNYCRYITKDKEYIKIFFSEETRENIYNFLEPVEITCPNCRTLTLIDIGGVKTRQSTFYKRQTIFICNTKMIINKLNQGVKINISNYNDFLEYLYKNKNIFISKKPIFSNNDELTYQDKIDYKIYILSIQIKELYIVLWNRLKEINYDNKSVYYTIKRYYQLIYNSDIEIDRLLYTEN